MGRPSLTLCALAGALAFAAPAAGDDIEEKAAVDARIATLQAEIDGAKEREGVLTSQLSAVVSELEAAQSAVDQAEGAHGLGAMGQRHDDVKHRGIGQARAVGVGRPRRPAWMGVIGADDLQTRRAGFADRRKVVGRLYLKFRPAPLEISGPCRILDDVGTTDEQPTALVR